MFILIYLLNKKHTFKLYKIIQKMLLKKTSLFAIIYFISLCYCGQEVYKVAWYQSGANNRFEVFPLAKGADADASISLETITKENTYNITAHDINIVQSLDTYTIKGGRFFICSNNILQVGNKFTTISNSGDLIDYNSGEFIKIPDSLLIIALKKNIIGAPATALLSIKNPFEKKLDSSIYSALKVRINSLGSAKKVLFLKQFKKASPQGLSMLNSDTSLVSFWNNNGEHIRNLTYVGKDHVFWDTTQIKKHIDTNSINSLTIMRKLDALQIFKAQVVGAVASSTGSLFFTSGHNSKMFDTGTLSPILKERIAYLTLIKLDEENNGKLFEILYDGVDKGKLHVAGDPGKHAEVIATDKIIKSGVVISQRSDLQNIKVLVRGKSFGSMCRCPHCFYILEGVTVLGSQN